ncbi:carbohydrate kinase family protein [Salinarchaeum sp. IM2453]|nr:carbohydrate kinase family protein [Salinarchaeum sp. IM2453]
MVQVLVAGHINWDVTMEVDRLPQADDEATIQDQYGTGGGSAANVAVGLVSLDIQTGLIGSVGTDQHGDRLKSELDAKGVDTAGVVAAKGPTSTKYLLVSDDGDVAVLGNDGVNESFTADSVPQEYLNTADHLHITSLHPEIASELAEIAVDANMTLSIDPGRRGPDRAFTRPLELSQLVFVSELEAQRLFDTPPDIAATADQTIIVTKGERGASLHTGTETITHPGYDIDPVDTSGAGDAFAAGFLSQWLTGATNEQAMQYGNACGAIASSQQGAQTKLSPDQIETSYLDN